MKLNRVAHDMSASDLDLGDGLDGPARRAVTDAPHVG